MDIQDQVNNNDDQELAMALANISQNNNSEEQPVPSEAPAETPVVPAEPAPISDYIATPVPVFENTIQNDGKSLENVRKDALTELRPLVDKLDMIPEDKFDLCLMLLRSTDDKSLIPTAYEAAKNIADETKRAQALLDVIREIDFLSTPEVA